MDRNKLISAILSGDKDGLEAALPTAIVECYQVEGNDTLYARDGSPTSAEKLAAEHGPNQFLEVKTYASHIDVPAEVDKG